jgi:gliding motility-associated-like protein
MRLQIYDRWGERVFESSDPAMGWNGKFRGRLLDNAVFAYDLTGIMQNGQKIRKVGNITLLR